MYLTISEQKDNIYADVELLCSSENDSSVDRKMVASEQLIHVEAIIHSFEYFAWLSVTEWNIDEAIGVLGRK